MLNNHPQYDSNFNTSWDTNNKVAVFTIILQGKKTNKA